MTNDATTLLQQKAKSYLNCFNDHCPKHDRCLRYLVGSHIDPTLHIASCISPHYHKVADGSCDYFRDNQPLRMFVGLKEHFYYEMPQHTMRSIKNHLIGTLGRTIYYEYHNGKRPITPDILSLIQSTCLHFGWSHPLHFDSETETYVW